MALRNDGSVVNGPQAGTPPPPTVQTPGSDPGGRPSGGAGSSLASTIAKFQQGFTPPTPAPPRPTSGGAGGAAPGVPSPPPSAASQPRTATAQPQPAGMVPGTGVPGATMLHAMPQPNEVDQLPPGSYETPLGTLVKGPDGIAKVILNPAGQEQYRKRFAESVQAFGEHPFSNDPNAPPPPITPGSVSYNAFTNTFTDSAPKPPGMA